MLTILTLSLIAITGICAFITVKYYRCRTREAVLEERLRLLQSQSDSQSAQSLRTATDILAEKCEEIRNKNELRISELISPLKEDLEKFRQSVAESYNAEARERFSLSERIRELVNLNQSISTQARELTDALRGNSKIQGDWGEMILEQILEKSGLKRDVHYVVQQTRDSSGRTLRNEDGALLRPDVVIHYPDGRCVVVDSKVSLTAYIAYVNAEDETLRKSAADKHILSVKSHIRELTQKRYQDIVDRESTDFVMMFIPNEGAYLTAMNLQPDLWQQAYDNRVLIISPTHLMSALKLIEQLWKHDDIKRNATEIAVEAGRMHDKFVGFLEDMAKIDKSLTQSRQSFDAALSKLSSGKGNLVRRASQLKELGAKAQKNVIYPASSVSATDNGLDE